MLHCRASKTTQIDTLCHTMQQAINPTAQGDGHLGTGLQRSTKQASEACEIAVGDTHIQAPHLQASHSHSHAEHALDSNAPPHAAAAAGGQVRGGEGHAEGRGVGNGDDVGGVGNGGAGAAGGALEGVPQFYFEKEFRLDDVGTFELTGASTEDAQAALDLHQLLSEHLDRVDHLLMREIQVFSPSLHPPPFPLSLPPSLPPSCAPSRSPFLTFSPPSSLPSLTFSLSLSLSRSFSLARFLSYSLVL